MTYVNSSSIGDQRKGRYRSERLPGDGRFGDYELLEEIARGANVCVLSVIVYHTMAHGVTHLSWSIACHFANRLRDIIGWVPWPLNIANRPYRFMRAYYLWNLYPIIFVEATTIWECSVIVSLALLPLWLVEQLRVILLPSSPVLSELLAYLVSSTALATLLASYWV